MKVRWTGPSVRDLTGICDFLEREASPGRARIIADRIYQAVEALRTFPRRGRPGSAPGTRELPIGGLPYLVYYEIREDEAVVILAIRHGARHWP